MTTHTKTCPTCGSGYDAEQRFCALDGAALRATEATGTLEGEVLAGRYLVRGRLGVGGMGEVYLAEHVRMGRRCAVKVMRATVAGDADAVSRFNREAANASRVSHPNVAAIYDFGETDEGLIYLAMEYVEGEPLRAAMEREGALPPARALAIAAQIADALDAAHALGIVHRDLKPDNVMLGRQRDGGDLVKVVDFGIAKAGDAAGQQVTRTGLIVGTPEFMSPEQLAGDPVDGRSDLYALALIAYAMLAGTHPYPSETVQDALVMRLTTSARRLADARPDVPWPAGLQVVLDRALARRPDDRFATARELAAALAAAYAGPGPSAAELAAGATVAIAAPVVELAALAAAETRVLAAAVPATIVASTSPARPDAAGAAARRARRGPRRIALTAAATAAVVLGAAALVQRDPGTADAAVAPTPAAPTAVATSDSAPAAGASSAPLPAPAGPAGPSDEPSDEPSVEPSAAPSVAHGRGAAPPAGRAATAEPIVAPGASERAALAVLAQGRREFDGVGPDGVGPAARARLRVLREETVALRERMPRSSTLALRLAVQDAMLSYALQDEARACTLLAATRRAPGLHEQLPDDERALLEAFLDACSALSAAVPSTS